MKLTSADIIAAVSKEFQLTPDVVRWGTNAANEVEARYVAMYIARKCCRMSYPQLGRLFGARHHTTVMHGVRKIEGLLCGNLELRDSVHRILTALRIENKWEKKCS